MAIQSMIGKYDRSKKMVEMEQFIIDENLESSIIESSDLKMKWIKSR